MGDELYDVRNALIIGNFHQVIAEGSNARTVLKKPEDVAAFNADRDTLVARAQIGLGQHDAVIAEHRNATNPSLVAVKLFAELQREVSNGGDGATFAQKLLDHTGSDVATAKGDAAILTAAALITIRDYTSALKLSAHWASALDSSANSRLVLEFRALLADAYLRLNRPDLAEKEANLMKNVDDESTLTILTQGIVALRIGATKRDKYDEAVQSFQEVTSRCGPSVLVFNLLALANLGRNKPQDAERNLLDALAKKSGDPDTIANLVVVSSQLGKPLEATQRYINQARAAAPQHQWPRAFAAMEQRFNESPAVISQ